MDSDGLAAAQFQHPFDIYLQKVDLESFPILRNVLGGLAQIPVLDQILKNSELMNGL